MWTKLEPIEYDSKIRNAELDEFLTPVELIEACVKRITRGQIIDAPLRILDAGANDGRWGKVARVFFPASIVTGIELMKMPKPYGFDNWIIEDFLAWETEEKFDLIIGNPPYSIKTRPEQKRGVFVAEKFVRKSLSLLDKGGIYAPLLRSNFRHSKGRFILRNGDPGLLQEWHYKEAHNTTLRPSFYKNDTRTKYFSKNNTNAHEYSLFIWHEQWKQNHATLDMPLDWQYVKG